MLTHVNINLFSMFLQLHLSTVGNNLYSGGYQQSRGAVKSVEKNSHL